MSKHDIKEQIWNTIKFIKLEVIAWNLSCAVKGEILIIIGTIKGQPERSDKRRTERTKRIAWTFVTIRYRTKLGEQYNQ